LVAIRDVWGLSVMDYAMKTKNKALITLFQKADKDRRYAKGHVNYGNFKPEGTPKTHRHPTLVYDDVFSLAKDDFLEDEVQQEDLSTSQEKSSEQTDTMKSIFPNIPTEVLSLILTDCNQNVEIATNHILAGEIANQYPPTPQTTKTQTPQTNFLDAIDQQWPTLPMTSSSLPGQPNVPNSQDYLKPSIQLLKELQTEQDEEKKELQLQKEKEKEKGRAKEEEEGDVESVEGSLVILEDQDGRNSNDQWVDVEDLEEGEDAESEAIDFDNGASFADSDKASSIVMVEPEEWDTLSQTSEISFHNELLEDKTVQDEVAETQTEKTEPKLSFAAALSSNLNQKQKQKQPKPKVQLFAKLTPSTFVIQESTSPETNNKNNKEKANPKVLNPTEEGDEGSLPDGKEIARGHGRAMKTRHHGGQYKPKGKPPKKTFKGF